jgi:hypothetical protein
MKDKESTLSDYLMLSNIIVEWAYFRCGELPVDDTESIERALNDAEEVFDKFIGRCEDTIKYKCSKLEALNDGKKKLDDVRKGIRKNGTD